MIEELLKHKELGHYDFGSVRTVYPTGRYIDAKQYQEPDYYQPHNRYLLEVRGRGWFSEKKWVSSNCLKPILKGKL